MKKFILLVMLFLAASSFETEILAQCTSYFQASYNSATGDIDFTTLCTYDTTISPILYQWDFGDGSTTFGNNPSHHYSSANGYLVCLVLYVGNGLSCCQDTFCEMIDFVPSRIEKNPEWIFDVAIYSSGKSATLFLTLKQTQYLQASIVTMTGRSIPVFLSNELMHGRNQIEFSFPDYPSGIYLLRIEDAAGNSVAKRFLVY